MPPRKSNVSTVSTEDTPKTVQRGDDDGLSVEDLNLPKSIVQRLSKGVLPPNTQIQKDALLAMSKSATVFVNYLTSTAAENAARSGKKTVMPNDVYEALKELEFENMIPRVEAEVEKFTSILADKRNTYRKKVREEKKAAKDKDTNGNAEDDGSPPAAKRARRSSVGIGGQAASEGEDDNVDETVDDAEQEDEEVEDDEVEEEAPDEGLTEDPLEEKENEPSDDDMADGNDSD